MAVLSDGYHPINLNLCALCFSRARRLMDGRMITGLLNESLR
jgi:hypothetical protein